MNTKTLLIASTVITCGLLAGCDCLDKPKKLNPDSICDAICQLSLKEQQELQDKVNQKHEDHLTDGVETDGVETDDVEISID